MDRVAAVITILIGAAVFLVFHHQPPSNGERGVFKIQRIAHAGGGIGGETYTNSYDAMDLNLQNGFTYFELDFSFTKDRRLVCIHDWEDGFKRTFGYEIKEIPTLKEFNEIINIGSRFKACTLDSLVDWMHTHPEVTIITDVKEGNNIDVLEAILEKLPSASSSVIPQIYNPGNYAAVRKLGFESIIWTLYRYRGNDRSVLQWVDRFDGTFAVTMPKHRAKSPLPQKLAMRNIPTYVHTVNEPEELAIYKTKYGLSEIYTDFLHP